MAWSALGSSSLLLVPGLVLPGPRALRCLVSHHWDLTAPLLSPHPHPAVGWQDGEERTGSPGRGFGQSWCPHLRNKQTRGSSSGSDGVPPVPALLQQGHPKKSAQGHVQAAVGDLQEEPPSPEDHRGGHNLGSGWFWGRPAWPYPTGRVRGCGRCCPRSRFVRILKGICTHAER